MTGTKRNTITVSVTMDDIYDREIYHHLVATNSRRRGIIMVELCKRGLAVEKAMNNKLGDFIEAGPNRSQNERAVHPQKTPNHVAVDDGAKDPFADDLKAFVDG